MSLHRLLDGVYHSRTPVRANSKYSTTSPSTAIDLKKSKPTSISTNPVMQQSSPVRSNKYKGQPQYALDPRTQQRYQSQDRNTAAPTSDGRAESVAGGRPQGSGGMKKMPLFKGKNLWPEGQSVVGRKGTDGEWVEMRCTIM